MKMHRFDKEDRRSAMIAELLAVASQLGRTPTVVQFKRTGPKFSYDELLGEFGSWNLAVSAAGLPANANQQPPSNKTNPKLLVEEFVRVANLLERIPSRPLFVANANFSRGPYEKHWGSWKKAVEEISREHRSEFTFAVRERRDAKALARRVRRPLGLDIPLKPCPMNEQETVVLFSILAAQLGYEIVSAQIGFPDFTLRKNERTVLAEVEYLSSSYLEHGHPQSPEYICVCWRHDRDIPGITAVISLEEVVRDLRKTCHSSS